MSSKGSGSQMGKFGQSSYSMGKSSMVLNKRAKASAKEDLIARKIKEIYKEKENRMIRTIESTIFEDKLRIYKNRRADFEQELSELEKEKSKIIKRKKNKKERQKALKAVTQAMMLYIVRAVQNTVMHYKNIYFENDNYRLKRLLDMQSIEKTETAKQKVCNEMLNNFSHSPFKEDRRFTIKYLNQMTRDRVDKSKDCINLLFFDKIFKLILTSSDETNVLLALDIVCNLMLSDDFRKRLSSQGYLRQIYDSVNLQRIDEKRVEKISHLTTLVTFYTDLSDLCQKIDMIQFSQKLVDPKFSPLVRSNGLLSISFLSYNEKFLKELIAQGVLDTIMGLCNDPKCDILVKQFATQALVHFALSEHAIQLLLQKDIMELLCNLKSFDNEVIHTNISWIFVALCNNGITGKQMLDQGITRDMFLVSCNPKFAQIRQLVIAGFAELGRCEDLSEAAKKRLPETLQRIKEKAIVGRQEAFAKKDAAHTIDVLLRFSLSGESSFRVTAFKALKDYILLNHSQLVDDKTGIISAFVTGASLDNEEVLAECADAISFLISNSLVFSEQETAERKQILLKEELTQQNNDSTLINPKENPDESMAANQLPQNQTTTGVPSNTNNVIITYREDFVYMLDSLMLLTASDSIHVRTRAFSTLSSLSTYAATRDYVMSTIQEDIKMPAEIDPKKYHEFIKERLQRSHNSFRGKFQTEKIEQDYAGLYCLLRLAQEPDESGTEEAGTLLRQFYYPQSAKKDGMGSLPASGQNSQRKIGEDINMMSPEEKKELSIHMFNESIQFPQETLVPQLDELNEKFFMFVFKALLYTENRRILFQILDVINFYITQKTNYQAHVICPDTILWILQLISKYRTDKDLSLFAAKTVLRIVNHHEIAFDYQELAIIKAINQALDNLSIDEDDQEKPVLDSEDKKQIIKALPIPHLASKVTSEINSSGADSVPTQDNKNDSLIENEQLQKDKKQGKEIENKTDRLVKEKPDFTVKKDPILVVQEGLSSNNMNVESEQIAALDKLIAKTQESVHDVDSKSNGAGLEQIRSVQSVQTPEKKGCQHSQQNMTQHEARQKTISPFKSSQKKNPSDTSKRSRSIFGKKSPTLQINAHGQIIAAEQHSQINKFDEQSVENKEDKELRDTLIKSFMVIFTNEKSQHLLLNKDIINIAFSCLEHCHQISQEAKENLATLISVLFKFPQVQDRLFEENIVLGIVYLLQSSINQASEKHVISKVLRAFSYISLNFEFVNSELSLIVLQALVSILDQVLNQSKDLNDQQLESQLTQNIDSQHTVCEKIQQFSAKIEDKSDYENCLLAISNFLKGKKELSLHFIQANGASKILQMILQNQKEGAQKANISLVEKSMTCIKCLTDFSPVFNTFLDFSDVNCTLLPLVLEFAFSVSDSWYESKTEIHLYKKIFVDGKWKNRESILGKSESDQALLRDLQTSRIKGIDHRNIEFIKRLEKLEANDDIQFVMASIVKLRQACYATAAACFKARFQPDYMLDRCQILKRIVADFSRNQDNDYLFQQLIQCLNSLKMEPQAIHRLFVLQAKPLIKLMKQMESNYKLETLVKTVTYLLLKAPQELLNIDVQIYEDLLDFADQFSKNEEIFESLIWMQSTLLEVNSSEEQHMKAIQICSKNEVHKLFLEGIQRKEERIVLQSLNGLVVLASIVTFRRELVGEFGNALFAELAKLITKRITAFTLVPNEIETTLAHFLAEITEKTSNQVDQVTVAARRRVVQQGFLDHFLFKSAQYDYKIVSNGLQDTQQMNLDMQWPEFDLKLTVEEMISQQNSLTERDTYNQTDLINIDRATLQSKLDYIGIEREESQKRLVEMTLQTAANCSSMSDLAESLILAKANLMQMSLGMLQNVIQSCEELQEVETDYVDFSLDFTEYCDLVKSLSTIMLNFVQHTRHSLKLGNQSIFEIALKNGILDFSVRAIKTINVYEVQTNLFTLLQCVATDPSILIQKQAVEADGIQTLIEGQEANKFFRVRCICQKAVNTFQNDLLDYNQKHLKEKRKREKKLKKQIEKEQARLDPKIYQKH